MSEPLLCAFLTSGRGALVRQLLRSTGEVTVVAVIRDRPSAIDDHMVPTGLRSGATLELLADLDIELVDCYLPKRGGDKVARLLLQEENVLFALGNAGVQLLVLVEYERELIPRGPLLKRYGAGQLLSVYPTMLSVVSKGEDGTAIFKAHAPVGPDDTLESLLRTFETAMPPADTRPSADKRWADVAATKGFPDEKTMWLSMYATQNLSFKELSASLGAAIATIRGRLVLHAIPIRPRGGVHDTSTQLTREEADTIEAEGIAVAARRLGLTYAALWWRVMVAQGKRQSPTVKDQTDGIV